MEIRCKQCNRLLYVQTGVVKQIRTSDNIFYQIAGDVTIQCKCGTINKF